MPNKKTEDLIKEMREKFKKLHESEFDAKDSYVKDFKFAFNIDSGHWDAADVEARDEEKRPHITSNKLSKFVAQVVNAEKASRMLMKLSR